MKVGRRVVLMYGFEKRDLGNIQKNKPKEFKASAKIYLGFSEERMSALVREKVLTEIKAGDEEESGRNWGWGRVSSGRLER
jgi:hypothetical protein